MLLFACICFSSARMFCSSEFKCSVVVFSSSSVRPRLLYLFFKVCVNDVCGLVLVCCCVCVWCLLLVVKRVGSLPSW